MDRIEGAKVRRPEAAGQSQHGIVEPNKREGLDFILESREYTRRIACAMDGAAALDGQNDARDSIGPALENPLQFRALRFRKHQL